MAEIGGQDGNFRDLGGGDLRPSRPSVDSTGTAPGTNIRFARAPSDRERGQPSASDNSGPSILQRFGSGRSFGSARIQPLQTPVTKSNQGVEDDGLAFYPQDLLEEGLGEWKDRASSLQTLKKSTSVSASRGYRGAEKTPSFTFRRRSHDSYGGIEGAARHSTDDEGDRGQFRLSGASQDGTYGGQGRSGAATAGIEARGSSMYGAGLQQESPARQRGERSLDLSQDFFVTLAEAPQASLIHLVSLYHQTLLRHGLVEEAEAITSELAGLQNEESGRIEREELKGMDLLLKEGLLKYLLSIQPHIPQVPRQVVKFKGVTYSMRVKIEKGYETMFTKIKGLIGGLLKQPRLENMTMLRDVTGYLMPGTLTLVVGPPGAGKRAFLNVIGGRPMSPDSSLSGTVTYNGNNVRDVNVERFAAVVSSEDVHLPSLTVRETLEFARDCSQAFRPKYFTEDLKSVMGEALKHGQDPKMEMNLSMLGLKRVADRPVGSPMTTEFQRHRLTTAEMFAGTYAVYLFDQLNSGGAVESQTFDMVTSIRMFTRVRKCTVLASILHPSEETLNLFDRIILLDSGQVMYQGPRQDVLPYFQSLGYVKPKHFSTSAFLSEVTTPEGVRYLQPGFPCLEREDFIASFLLSPTFRDIRRVVDCADPTQEQIWVQGRRPLGLKFTEKRSDDASGPTRAPASILVDEVIENEGTLADASMDHTSSVSPGDEVVAVGGAGVQLKYFKTNNRHDNSSSEQSLSQAIDQVAESVRLQLQRHFDPVKLTGVSRIQFMKGYVLKFRSETKVLLKRELKVLLRNKLGLELRFAQVLTMSTYTGVVFFRVQNDPDQLVMNLKRGVFFISVLNMTLINLGQLPGLLEERAVYYKQQGARFFRPQSFLFAKLLATLPFSFLEATLWTVVIYFMTGLNVESGSWHFWVFYLIMILTAINGSSLVRFMAYFAPDRDAANAFIGVLIAIFIIFAGFLVPRFSVPHYWLWAYYIDPLQWATTALVINEFNSKSYSMLCSQVTSLVNLPQCVGRPTNTVGHAYIARGQFYTSDSWIAVAVAVLLGWIVLWNLGAYYALTRRRHHPQTLSPYMEMKLTSSQQHQFKAIDEEWGQAEVKLSLTSFPVTLSWHELSYDVMIPAIGQTRTVLKYVSGWGNPGEMVAFLGGHGAGKTTLLNCLAGRKVSSARVGGQILVNGYPRVHKTFAHVVGYVEDIMAYVPYITVREGIEFSAAMRLSKNVGKKERKLFAEEIMNLVQISHISDMLLMAGGNEEILKEQSVRLAIATELAGNPSVLFLDEPLKGLDTHASRHIIECLRTIANTGRLVIVSLQQPSLRELSNFNTIQVLKNGETVYFKSGEYETVPADTVPVGTAAEFLIKYFEAIPGTPRCPRNKNPVAYALEVIGDGSADGGKAHRDYAFEYRVSELALRNHIVLQNLRRSKGQNGPELRESGYRAPYSVMAWEVVLKIQRIYWRNTKYNFGRLIGALILALILGTVYFNINPHTTVNMNVKSQSLFILCVLLAISNAQSIVPLLLRMNSTMERDQETQQYSVWLHSMAWTFGEIPYMAVTTMIVCFVFCLMAQMAVDSAAQFFRFYFVLLEFSLAITFLGIVVVVISQRPAIAAVIISVVIGFWTSTGGSVVPKRKILPTVIWVFWSNPLQYVLNALTSIAFFCDTNKPTCLDSGRNLACLNDPTACPLCDCKRLDDARNAFLWTTLEFNRSLNHSRVPLDMLALALFCVVFRIAAGIVISYRKQKRLASKK